MAFSWSEKQIEAFESSGKNLLISAAAGSGKTAVLTQRVIEKLKQGVALDRLVILTFTNKAAAEMRERIRTRIMADSALKDALPLLEQAHIKTFDAYALHLLKKYGYHMNVSNKLSVLSQTDALLIKHDILTALINERYRIKDERFIAYLDDFATKDDKILQQTILHVHDQLALNPERKGFLENLRTAFFSDDTFSRLFSDYETRLLEKAKAFYDQLRHMASRFTHPLLQDYIDADKKLLRPLVTVKDHDTLYRFLQSGLNFRRLSLPKTGADPALDEEKDRFKDQRDQLKKEIKKFSAIIDRDKEAQRQAFLNSGAHIDIIVELTLDFIDRYQTHQRQTEQFDFASAATLALKIIKDYPEVRKEIMADTHEVMVDEYQDTNWLQEVFLRTITEDNLYMVGDVKQSIYRFRHAEPAIFVEKYLQYRATDTGKVIDLNQNFRSRKEVLSDINTIFEHTMDKTIGGIDYDTSQKLYYGNRSFETLKASENRYGLTYHHYDKKTVKEALPANFKAEAVEFFRIGQIIKEKIRKGEKIKDGDTLRPVRYGDFTILIDRKSKFKTAADIFRYLGIPLLVHRSKAFVSQDDMLAVKQLLTLLVSLVDEACYEKNFHHAFLSVTRSFLYRYDDDMITQELLRFPRRYPGKEALEDILKTSDLKALKDTLQSLVPLVRNAPLITVLEHTFETTAYDEKLVEIPDTLAAIERKRDLLAIGEVQSRQGVDLKAFVTYFDAIVAAQADIEIEKMEAFVADKVNLMTMHKSKGLQFPIVFLPHLSNLFQGDRDPVRIDQELGLIIQNEDEGLDKHFLYHLHDDKNKAAENSEKLRLLYVALTRAIEEVHLIGETLDDADTFEGVAPYLDRLGYNSFRSVFQSVAAWFEGAMVAFDPLDFLDDADYETKIRKRAVPDAPVHKAYDPVPLETQIVKDTRFSGGIDILLTPEQLENIDYGNLLHDAFEHLDFKAPIQPQLDEMVLDDQTKSIIRKFFDQPFIKNLKFTGVYKEYPFARFESDTQSLGFIDLLLETRDKFIVVDYKLRDLNKPTYIEQVKAYCDMLSEVSEKTVEGYLYSMLDATFKKIV